MQISVARPSKHEAIAKSDIKSVAGIPAGVTARRGSRSLLVLLPQPQHCKGDLTSFGLVCGGGASWLLPFFMKATCSDLEMERRSPEAAITFTGQAVRC